MLSSDLLQQKCTATYTLNYITVTLLSLTLHVALTVVSLVCGTKFRSKGDSYSLRDDLS